MARIGPWLRWLLAGVLGVLALGLLLSVLAIWALRAPRVQQAVVERLSRWSEAELGFTVEAAGFRLRPLAGTLEVDALRLRAPGARPFASAGRLRARWLPTSLLGGRLHVETLEVERPVVDLRAPLPAGRESQEGAPPVERLPLEVDRLSIRDGDVLGPAAAGMIADWSLQGLQIHGGFDGRRLQVRELTAAASIGLVDREPVRLDVGLQAAADLGGRLEVESLRLTGEALSARLAGLLGPDLEATRVAFEVETDPGFWLLGEPTGSVTARGEIEPGAWRGAVALETGEQPGALVGVLVSPRLAKMLELDATSLQLDAELRLEHERSVSGTARLGASRDGLRVLEVVARPRLGIRDDLPVELSAEATLLPGEAGTRRLAVRLSSPAARSLEAWRIDEGDTTIDQPGVDRLMRRIAGLYPRLLDWGSVPDLPPLGRLALRGRFSGPVSDPELEATAELRPHAGGRITLAASGRALAGPLVVETTGANIDIAHFTGAAAGRLDWTGRVSNPLGAAAGSLELTARGVATAKAALLDSLAASISGGRREIAWRLEGRLAGGGRVAGGGTVEPVLPLRRAAGDLIWTTGDERLPRVRGSFGLGGGELAARVQAAVGGRDALAVEARVPLAALDAIPQLAGLAELPLVRRPGAIAVEWAAPSGGWGAVVPAALAERIGRLEGGSSGRLAIDPACPTCSEGVATVSDLELELDGRRTAAARDLRLELADGRLRVEPWSLTGEGFRLDVEGDLELSPSWQPQDDLARLVAKARAGVAARLDSAWLESLPVAVETPGAIAVRAEVSGPFDHLEGTAEISAPDLRIAATAYPGVMLAEPTARLSLGGGLLTWEEVRLRVGDAIVTSHGRARLEQPLSDAAGRLHVVSGMPVIEAVTLPFAVTGGVLRVEDGTFATAAGAGSLRLEAPLDRRSQSVASLEWSVPANDWAPLLARLGTAGGPEVLESATRGSVTLSLDRPALTDATVVLDSARVVVRGRETRIEPSLELSVSEGELRVAPVTLRSATESFSFQARAGLDRAWTLADRPAALVTEFDLSSSGAIDAGLLNPFLAGGRAEGTLGLDIAVRGSPTAYRGRVHVEGPEASLLFRSPYLTRLQRPSLRLAVANGRIALEEGSMLLNEGVMKLSGVLRDERGTDLRIQVSEALFRLDYGLLATLGGDLRYRLAADGSSSIAGTLDLERGSLTRSVQLDLDLLSQLLTPIDLTTTEDDPLELVALDVTVRTREGVRVKNNLGDLLVQWEPFTVTGTLARPVLEGRLEVDPGGLLRVYGQTVRLDKAVIEYPGSEGGEPRLDFEATTSLEDPTIGRLAGDDPFRDTSRGEQAVAPAAAEVTADLARYMGDQFAGRVGESVGVKLSLRPLLIFGEADPGARLTVSRDLSPNLSLAASVDLRQAEGRTYLLEVHELRQLPRLVAQAFTDDQSAYGGALLQRREFGGAKRTDDRDLPRVSKVAVEPPAGTSKRGIKRALGIEKGSLFDTGQRFLAEVELVDYLLRKGYPDARVSVRPTTADHQQRRVRLDVMIEPGPRVQFAFEGERIPKPLRPLVTNLYRPDFFEAESIEEMKAETVRALRSRGFLEPMVEITVEPSDGGSSIADRRVVVRTEGGAKLSPERPVFLGIPPADAEALDAFFVNAVKRVELAVGLPSADRRLLGALADLGYPEARIVRRYQSPDERVLTVELEPGARQRVAGVAIEGVDAGAALSSDELEPLLTVGVGDPLHRSQLTRSAIAIERALASRGHLEARVKTVVGPADGQDPYAVAVRFVVDPGTASRLGEVDFMGLRSTRERWARRVTGLEPGQPVARRDLAEARTRLWRTGLFSGVVAETSDAEPGFKRVVFDLTERDRYRLAYGVRWESEEGFGAVVDANDDNFLGRGWTLGLRALYSSEENSLRGLTRIPRAFGGPGTFEVFAGAREVTDVTFGASEVELDIREGTLQYSHPVGARTNLRIYGRYTDTTRALPLFTLRVKNPQLGLQYVYDGRSPEPLTERGILASVDLSGSQEFLGGDLRYVRLFSQVNLYRPVGRLLRRGLSWSQSYRLGLAEAFDQELIRDVRFFAGGEYSVRGYQTEALGELVRFGSIVEPAGGEALLVVNQELRWRLFEDYVIVLFVDAGNVWQETGDLGLDLLTSAGLGLRAQTPIGLLRLDLAHALDRRPDIDPEFKLYLGLGTTF